MQIKVLMGLEPSLPVVLSLRQEMAGSFKANGERVVRGRRVVMVTRGGAGEPR